MDALTVIAGLRRRGIRLRLDGDHLIVTPAALVSSNDADWFRANKPAVVAVLAAGAETIGWRLPLRTDCVTCGAALDERSAVRCPSCVNQAYRARDRRRELAGPDPPSPKLDRPNGASALTHVDHTAYPMTQETERPLGSR